MSRNAHNAVDPAKSADAAWRQVAPPNLTPILAHALDAFYENGFHGATVRDIAKRVGVTVPALYYHHGNKEGLLLALLESSTSDVLTRAHTAAAEGGTDPAQQLANLIEAVALTMTKRARLAAIEGEVRYLSPENRLRYRVFRKGIENLVLSIIESGNSAGIFHADDAAETSRAILAMCQSVPRWYHADGELTPEVVAEKYVTIALTAAGFRSP